MFMLSKLLTIFMFLLGFLGTLLPLSGTCRTSADKQRSAETQQFVQKNKNVHTSQVIPLTPVYLSWMILALKVRILQIVCNAN